MCGFAAIYSYSADASPVDGDVLASISQAMVRRGPDGDGLWLSDEGRVGMAHRRLAIIDLSNDAAQPMMLETPKGRFHISYNGEIYNFRELRHDLEVAGHHFKTFSDTEVLLHLYERYGRDMVERLRGMFAFAIWDENCRGMLLARDGFGIKPLYYLDQQGSFTAASQVKALLAGLKAQGRPRPDFDAAGHAGFFLFGNVPEPHTLYKGIKALKAGTTLWVDSNGAGQEKPFFDISNCLAAATWQNSNEDLGELLRDSVSHHFIADVPVGVFLSSGLDSATLVGLASELLGARLKTVSLGFDEFEGSPNDEVPLAETIAATYDTHQHSIRVAGKDFVQDMDDLLVAMDQPSIDGVNTYFVAKAAAAQGLKVAISGLGGDEIFGGYDSFSQVPNLVGSLGRIPGVGEIGRFLRSLTIPLTAVGLPPKAPGLFEYSSCYGDAYLLRRALYMPWELSSVLGEDMAYEGLKALQVRQRLDSCQSMILEPEAKVSALELNWYMRNQLLRDADWAGMAHGLEIRVPFVDTTLFKALAGAIATSNGPGKQEMAATPRKALPNTVINRPKSGFFVPISDWMEGSASTKSGLRGWANKVYQTQTSQ
jgi:asparagine synthase (glutamine-hydrolysing)